MRSKLGVEEREGIFKGGKAPAETVFDRATVTTVTSILYRSLVACVFGEKRRPEGQVGIDDIIRYGTHDIVVAVIEGARARSQPKMGLCVNVWVRHLKHRGRHLVAHGDGCCDVARLLGKPRMSPSGERESSSPEKLEQKRRRQWPVKCCASN